MYMICRAILFFLKQEAKLARLKINNKAMNGNHSTRNNVLQVYAILLSWGTVAL
jgi:hypothetical protein